MPSFMGDGPFSRGPGVTIYVTARKYYAFRQMVSNICVLLKVTFG